jgi:hypothetical protein
MERARFIEHRGKSIFLLDCSNASIDEIHAMIDECARQVRAQPPQSVLTLTVAGGGKFAPETIQRLKELTKGNKPHVRASAVVGITGLYRVVISAVSLFSERRFHLFDDVEDAKNFLAGC